MEREQLKVFQDRGMVVVVIDRGDLDSVVEGASFIDLLRSKYERVRLDLTHSVGSVADIQSGDSVQTALKECDQLGRDTFLQKYGFGRARKYFLEYEEKLYDFYGRPAYWKRD